VSDVCDCVNSCTSSGVDILQKAMDKTIEVALCMCFVLLCAGIFVLFVHMRNSCIVPLQGLKCSTASMNSACGWDLVDPSCFCELDFGRKDCPSQHHNRRLERHCMEEQMFSHDGVLLLFLFHLYEVYLCLTLCN
jgi:hypothetical protein